MVQIYVMDISELKEQERYERAYALSDHRRQQKADALSTAAGKACCIGAGLLLSFSLRKMGIQLKDTELVYNEFGKPFLKEHENVFFNLSHSGCMVACVVGNVPCGIDIQKVQAYNPKLVKRFFAKEEQDYLEGFLEGEKRDIYYTYLFSSKESHAKRDGISAVAVLSTIVDQPFVYKIIESNGQKYVLTVTT